VSNNHIVQQRREVQSTGKQDGQQCEQTCRRIAHSAVDAVNVTLPQPRQCRQTGAETKAQGHKWKQQRAKLLQTLQSICIHEEQVERVTQKAQEEILQTYDMQELPQDRQRRHNIQADILHKAIRIAKSRERMRNRRTRSRLPDED
jgi:hypothetical protein